MTDLINRAGALGQPAGNHFITTTSNLAALPPLGKIVPRHSAQSIRFGLI